MLKLGEGVGGSLWPCRARTQGSASIPWHGWQSDMEGYSEHQGWHLLAQYGGRCALFGANIWGKTVKCTRQGAGGQQDPRGDTSSNAHQMFLGGPLQDPLDNMSIKGMVQQLKDRLPLRAVSLRENGGGGRGEVPPICMHAGCASGGGHI